MSDLSFENYTSVARQESLSNIEVSGRYAFQALAEKAILSDLVRKLALEGSDTLLEIGCGPGNLLVPLSYWVSQATGIDNEISLLRLRARCADDSRVITLAGNFLTMPLPDHRYSRILIYSVVQYLDTIANALEFVERALQLLLPGGCMLLGDLPNSDKKKRWAQSSAGIAAATTWREKLAQVGEHPLSEMPVDGALVAINDEFVLMVMLSARRSGFESYLLSQPPELPFGNSREDILFVKPS